MVKSLIAVAVTAVFLATSIAFAQEKTQTPKPVPKPAIIKEEMLNLPKGAPLPKKKPNPSPREKALAAQLHQLEKQRDALINRSVELDRKRFSTQDPAERKRLDAQKLELVKQLAEVIKKRDAVYRAWQKAAMERWRKENPEAFQAPPGMPPGMTMPPQIIAKQIEIAKEQLAKLKKQGKPDTDPQVKMYQERIERYTKMLKTPSGRPPIPPGPKVPEK